MQPATEIDPQFLQQQQLMGLQQYQAMIAQQQMMFPNPYPHPYMGYYHLPQEPNLLQGSSDENKTIWVGDLQYWMDENYLHNCFAHTGEVASIKVIRNKHTGQTEGYGFVEFLSHATAVNILQNYNGTAMPNTEHQPFRLNWASSNTGDKRLDANSDLSIFVGDLASDVNDAILQETFACRYPSVTGAKVIMDAMTGRSKGYGFVRFSDENERNQAMSEMNGAYCSSRPMRVGAATPRKNSSSSFQGQDKSW